MYGVLKPIIRIFLFFVFRIKIYGTENIPTSGGVIFAPNHRSNWDPVILFALSKRKLCFMAKAELFKSRIGAWLFSTLGVIPVDRQKNDIHAVKQSLKQLSGGQALCIFPEGTRVTNEENVELKSGVCMIAHRGKSKIIPTYIKGRFSWFSEISVIYGEPMDFESFDNKKLTAIDYDDISKKLWENIKGLENTVK